MSFKQKRIDDSKAIVSAKCEMIINADGTVLSADEMEYRNALIKTALKTGEVLPGRAVSLQITQNNMSRMKLLGKRHSIPQSQK